MSYKQRKQQKYDEYWVDWAEKRDTTLDYMLHNADEVWETQALVGVDRGLDGEFLFDGCITPALTGWEGNNAEEYNCHYSGRTQAAINAYKADMRDDWKYHELRQRAVNREFDRLEREKKMYEARTRHERVREALERKLAREKDEREAEVVRALLAEERRVMAVKEADARNKAQMALAERQKKIRDDQIFEEHKAERRRKVAEEFERMQMRDPDYARRKKCGYVWEKVDPTGKNRDHWPVALCEFIWDEGILKTVEFGILTDTVKKGDLIPEVINGEFRVYSNLEERVLTRYWIRWDKIKYFHENFYALAKYVREIYPALSAYNQKLVYAAGTHIVDGLKQLFSPPPHPLGHLPTQLTTWCGARYGQVPYGKVETA